MDDTFNRITTLMKQQNIQDNQMIEYLGLSKGTFANWRRGKGETYYCHIARIADRLGVSIDYLVRGVEIKTDALTSQEARLIENYRIMTDDARDAISRTAEILAKQT